MAEIFVIRLADGAQVSWLPIDTTGARSGSVEHGPLSVAAEKVGDRRVVILAPANRVLLDGCQLGGGATHSSHMGGLAGSPVTVTVPSLNR